MKRFQEWLSDMALEENTEQNNKTFSKERNLMITELQNYRVCISCGGIFPLTFSMLASVSNNKYLAFEIYKVDN